MQSSGIPLRSPVLRLGSPHKLIHLSLANKPHHSRRWNALSVPLLPDPQIGGELMPTVNRPSAKAFFWRFGILTGRNAQSSLSILTKCTLSLKRASRDVFEQNTSTDDEGRAFS
jgi:hypothetical protein